jgi:tripartite-type tricarboxylate transporter receptor subunit TctC
MEREITSDFTCNRRHFLRTLSIGLGTLAIASQTCISSVLAKEIYPAERITCIISQKAGAGYDILARAISPYVTQYLQAASQGAKGGSIVVKNDPAAGGQRAYDSVYRAKPNGYTICIFDIGFATETLMSQLDFDIQKFTYLIRINFTTRILVTGKNGFANWGEMVKFAKEKEVKWGVGAMGRAIHIDSIIVKEETGLAARFVPFGGTAENMNALLRGDIHVAMASQGSVDPLIDAGEIKVLTQFAEKSDYPGIPSIKDLGYPVLAGKLGGHRFLIAPPGLPKDIGNTLTTAFKMALNDKEFQAWAKKSNIPLNPVYGDEAEKLARYIIRYYQEDLRPVLNKYLK